MLKNKRILIIIISLLCMFTSALADNNIKMLVKFDVADSKLLTNASFGNVNESFAMSCAGYSTSVYPNGYYFTGSLLTDKGLEIGVTGPFPEDKRTTCQIVDQTTHNTNDVYFSVESMPIFFTYNGEAHSCYINQNVGTSWNNADRHNDKLQGESTGVVLPCNGLVSTDVYQVNHGTGDDKGNITIKVLGISKAFISFKFSNSNQLESFSLSNYKMPCKGQNNGYSVTNTDISSYICGPHGTGCNDLSGEIQVTGPFIGDSRNTCEIIDHHTANATNNVYFILSDLLIYFSYSDGKQHSCHIDQQIGTSYFNHLLNSRSTPYYFSKLQGEYTESSIPCHGLVDGDTYKIQPGTAWKLSNMFNSAGYIEINASN